MAMRMVGRLISSSSSQWLRRDLFFRHFVLQPSPVAGGNFVSVDENLNRKRDDDKDVKDLEHHHHNSNTSNITVSRSNNDLCDFLGENKLGSKFFIRNYGCCGNECDDDKQQLVPVESLRGKILALYFDPIIKKPSFIPGSPGFQRESYRRRWNNNQIALSSTLVLSSSMRESEADDNYTISSDDANYTTSPDVDLIVIDPVLKRPKFYIGGKYRYGSYVLLHHLVNELLLNAVDQAQSRFFATVDVVLAPDGSSLSVTDNGSGAIEDICKDINTTMTHESAMEILRAGGLTDDTYIVPRGLYGVGLSVVNALSQALEVTCWPGGVEYRQKYTRGKPTTPHPDGSVIMNPRYPEDGRHGTRITFWPDKAIFTSETHFDYGTISRRIKELAYLNPGLTITIRKENTDPEKKSQYHEYCYPGGVKDFVRYMNSNRKPLHDDILGFSKQVNGCAIDIAFQWCEDPASDTILLGYVNGTSCPEGGAHIEGARYDYTRGGFTCVVSVKIKNPAFDGLTLTRMVNNEVFCKVCKYVSEYLTDYLMLHPNLLDAIHAKCENIRRADTAARIAASAAAGSAATPARRAITARAAVKNFFVKEKNLK